MTGVSAIQYYSVTIYEQMGIAGDETLKYQAISSIIALIAQFLCILFIDHFGRRWPLILGNLGNMVTFIISTILLATFPPGTANNKAAAWGFIVITWAYNFCFSATCGPLSWIIPAEIFDTKTRAKGVSIATMLSFAFNTMIGQVTGIAMESVGWKFYILFIVSRTIHHVSRALLIMQIGLQLYQRNLLLLFPSRDGQASPRRDELPLHKRTNVRPRYEQARLDSWSGFGASC
jgi:MFS family permease